MIVLHGDRRGRQGHLVTGGNVWPTSAARRTMHHHTSISVSQQVPFGIIGWQPEAAALRVAVSEVSADGIAAARDGLNG